MKKICSILLSALLLLSPIFQVSAYDIIDDKKIAVKNILVTKSQLKKLKNWDEYINAMDNFAEKIKESEEKLDSIKIKINLAINKIESKKRQWNVLSRNETQLLSILKYLDARITFMQLDIKQKNENATEEKIQNILDTVNNPNINDSDKKKVEDAIITIQKNLLEKTKQSTKNILWDFEDYFNYESQGDFEMNFDIDHDSVGKVKAEMKLSDYITQNSNFDSRFQWYISAMIDTLPKWEEAIQAELSSFIDFISTDGQLFALVKDLKIVNEDQLDEIEEVISIMKTLAKENNYIEIPDSGNVAVMEMLQSFHPDNFFNDAEKLFLKPMFTAYEKKWDVYSIIPTKYACDSLKVLTNKFDPFSPNSCTDSQYKDIIKDIISEWELTMTLGNENILKYSYTADNTVETFDITVAFTDSSINKFDINIIADQKKYKNEQFILSYWKNQYLDIDFYANKWEFDFNFTSILDSNNKFSEITHSAYIQSWNDIFTSNLTLKNKSISWTLKIESDISEYNYDTGKYEKNGSEYIGANISGNTNYQNELNNINITYIGNDGEKNYLNGELVYNLPHLKFVSKYKDEYWNAEFIFDGQWNNFNKNFDSFTAQAEIKETESNYNYETYEYESTWVEEKIFDMNYTLTSWNVNGTLNAYDNDEVMFWIVTSGTYKKDLLRLNNKLKTTAIDIFNSQIDRARDTTRITDIYILSNAVEMYYQDNAEYPTKENFNDAVSQYLSEIPTDPKWNVEMNGCKFGYKYAVWNDENGIKNSAYNLSTCFESERNLYKAESDNGNDSLRYEKWSYINQKMSESFYINNYTSWEKIDWETYSEPVINFNFGYDYTSNNTNTDLHIDVIYEDKKVFDMNIKNTGTIEYKKIDIQAPKDSVPMEDVIDTMY